MSLLSCIFGQASQIGHGVVGVSPGVGFGVALSVGLPVGFGVGFGVGIPGQISTSASGNGIN